MNVTHHPGCTANYPEKPEGEAPQQIIVEELPDGYKAWTCCDCGASETNLPPEDDPYWDDVRK